MAGPEAAVEGPADRLVRTLRTPVRRIVQAAYEVINERGYAAATFQEIAKRSELSRPTLNYYFASRDELYRALLEQAHEVVTSCIDVAKEYDRNTGSAARVPRCRGGGVASGPRGDRLSGQCAAGVAP